MIDLQERCHVPRSMTKKEQQSYSTSFLINILFLTFVSSIAIGAGTTSDGGYLSTIQYGRTNVGESPTTFLPF